MTNLAKKVSIITTISMVFCSFTSCKRIQNIKDSLTVSFDSNSYLKKACNCFKNYDVNGLYNLFSEESKQDALQKRVYLRDDLSCRMVKSMY